VHFLPVIKYAYRGGKAKDRPGMLPKSGTRIKAFPLYRRQ
jgi:hypothetical protein